MGEAAELLLQLGAGVIGAFIGATAGLTGTYLVIRRENRTAIRAYLLHDLDQQFELATSFLVELATIAGSLAYSEAGIEAIKQLLRKGDSYRALVQARHQEVIEAITTLPEAYPKSTSVQDWDRFSAAVSNAVEQVLKKRMDEQNRILNI